MINRRTLLLASSSSPRGWTARPCCCSWLDSSSSSCSITYSYCHCWGRCWWSDVLPASSSIFLESSTERLAQVTSKSSKMDSTSFSIWSRNSVSSSVLLGTAEVEGGAGQEESAVLQSTNVALCELICSNHSLSFESKPCKLLGLAKSPSLLLARWCWWWWCWLRTSRPRCLQSPPADRCSCCCSWLIVLVVAAVVWCSFGYWDWKLPFDERFQKRTTKQKLWGGGRRHVLDWLLDFGRSLGGHKK